MTFRRKRAKEKDQVDTQTTNCPWVPPRGLEISLSTDCAVGGQTPAVCSSRLAGFNRPKSQSKLQFVIRLSFPLVSTRAGPTYVVCVLLFPLVPGTIFNWLNDLPYDVSTTSVMTSEPFGLLRHALGHGPWLPGNYLPKRGYVGFSETAAVAAVAAATATAARPAAKWKRRHHHTQLYTWSNVISTSDLVRPHHAMSPRPLISPVWNPYHVKQRTAHLPLLIPSVSSHPMLSIQCSKNILEPTLMNAQ